MSKEKEVSVETAPELLPTTANTSDLVEVTSEGTPPAFEVVKAVTRTVMKLGVTPEFIRIEGPIYLGEPTKKAVPHLLNVINLRTGEPALIVCGTVFRTELEAEYPDSGYVGKDFKVRKIKTDKNYSLWSIIEIKFRKHL